MPDPILKSMRIGLIGRKGDRRIQALTRALTRRKAKVLFFDASLDDSQKISFENGACVWNGQDLAAFDILFLSGFTYDDPVVPLAKDRLDWSLWRCEYPAEQQRYSLLHSLIEQISASGKPSLINPAPIYVKAFKKPFLLEELRRAGFPVPELVVTNRPDDAQDFLKRRSALVWRPVTGRALWQVFTERQARTLMAPGKPPVMLAEAVEGPLVRGYLFRGDPWLLLSFNATSPSHRHERLEAFWDLTLPEATAGLARLAAHLDAPWIEVLFVWKDGQPFLYDFDPDPSFEDLPVIYSKHLVARLASALAGTEDSFVATGAIAPKKAHERPTMFLRRMIDILFEFERIKYPPKEPPVTPAGPS